MDDVERNELSWGGWGDPARAAPLPPGLLELLRGGLGIEAPTRAPASISELELAPIRLGPGIREALVAIVGEPYARSDHEQRARHALGKSTVDLLALRAGKPVPAPDLVLFPHTHEQILAVLELCSQRHVAVVPFGGGTSVVGGLAPW